MSLAHKGLDFRSVPTPFTSKSPAVEGGVSKTVPVIRDGDASRQPIPSTSRSIWTRPIPIGRHCSAAKAARRSARFIERWSQMTIHPYLGAPRLMDIHVKS